MAEAQRREMRELLASQTNWVLVHASSAYKYTLPPLMTRDCPSQTKWVLVHATSAYKYTLPPSRQRRGRCVASGL